MEASQEHSEGLAGRCKDWKAVQPPVTILPHGPTIEVLKGA